MTLDSPFLGDDTVQPSVVSCSSSDDNDSESTDVEILRARIRLLEFQLDKSGEKCRYLQQTVRLLTVERDKLQKQLDIKNGLGPPPEVSIHVILSSVLPGFPFIC